MFFAFVFSTIKGLCIHHKDRERCSISQSCKNKMTLLCFHSLFSTHFFLTTAVGKTHLWSSALQFL